MENKDINKNVSTTLLNPDKWDGRYERRAGPLIKALALIAIPIIPITNICLWLIKLFGLLPVLIPTIIIYIYYTWRIIAIVLLDEKERLKQFKYNLYNKYEEPENMFKIQSLSDDGCIEYVNGDGGYMVVCHNGEEIDERLKSMQIAKFLENLDDCSVDILIFIASCVRGDTRDENQKFNRKTVIRMRASDYKGPVKLNIENIDEDTPIISEEEKLNKIPAQRLMETYTRNSDFITRLTQITGLHSSGKTTFMLLLAQYLSGYGKTVIIETDLKYFSISYNIEMGNLECTKIPLSSFYLDPLEFVEKIKNSADNLICLTCTSKDKLNPPNIQHILDVIYNILNKEIRYILLEEPLENITFNLYTIVLMQNNVISAIKTIDSLPNRIDNCLFAAVDTSIEDISIYDSKVLEKILSLQTSYNNKEIPIYSIKNLKLGKGEGIYDLRRYV